MKHFIILLSIVLLASFSFSQNSAKNIRVNQIGFLPHTQKRAVIIDAQSADFEILNEKKVIVFTGKLGKKTTWPQSGEKVQLADFSTFTTPGTYTIRVKGNEESYPFTISETALYDVNNAIVKAFYLNRASIEILPEFAGKYARKMGHPDTEAIILPSAAGPIRKAGDKIPAAKGWYDAGDYNKYIVNSAITVGTMLLAYENYTSYFDTLTWNIPESKNGLPDLLDEVKWNLDWMLTMQDPADGGVYNKTTDEQFSGMIMPDKATTTRYVVSKSTAATLDFAATMALSYRIYKKFDAKFAETCLQSAIKAWDWAIANPNIIFKNPEADGKYPKIKTGGYGDKNFSDEKLWAASELLIATQNAEKYGTSIDLNQNFEIPVWYNVGGLSLYSLYTNRQAVSSYVDIQLVTNKLLEKAQALQTYQENENAYKVPVVDFSWGSNGVLANEGILFLYAYTITGKIEYYNAALSAYDYMLGRNATEYSFITEYGEKCPKNIHHRPSEGDKIEGSVPGFLAGGPNGGLKRDCIGMYSTYAAKAYYDGTCSYTTNEIAINWQAPMTYLAHGLVAEYFIKLKNSSEPFVNALNNEIICKRTDTVATVAVLSNTKWSANTNSTWFKIETLSQNGNSFITIKIIKQNNEENIREGKFDIVMNDKVVETIIIKQYGKPKKFRIEAENFVHMNNVQTEQTTDEGGGLNVGWINDNDFMTYSIDIPETGSYKIDYRVSCVDSAANLYLSFQDSIYSRIDIAPTGGWQTWTNISDTAYFNEGVYEIMLYAPKGGFNINYMNFVFISSENLAPVHNQKLKEIEKNE